MRHTTIITRLCKHKQQEQSPQKNPTIRWDFLLKIPMENPKNQGRIKNGKMTIFLSVQNYYNL